MILSTIWSNPLDNSIAIAMSQLFDSMGRVFKNIFISISAFGDNGIFYVIVGILLVLFARTRKIGFALLFSALITLLFNDLIFKNIFDRTRPFNDPELLKNLVSVTNNGGVVYGIVPSSSSFPSGHTFNAFAAFSGLLSLYIFDKENRKHYLGSVIFFGVFAVLMGFSRILLSHHYFTDVLAGALIGLILGFSIYWIIKYFYKGCGFIKGKFKKNQEGSNL